LSAFTDSCNGRPFINPNFSVFNSHGNLYFSDSGHWRKGNGVVFRVEPDSKTSVFAEGQFHFANGLAMDADERFLYLVESNTDRVLRMEMNSDGRAGLPEVYADGIATVPDGLAFDALGNLCVTSYGPSCIYRVDTKRHVELLCQDIECEILSLVTNCAFAGPNFYRPLAANLGVQHLSILDLKVKGQPLAHHHGLCNHN
jgi:gluconolactonase